MNFDEFIFNVVIASFGCVGLIEVLKNFIKTEKKWIFSLIMIPLSVGCYALTLYDKAWAIGGVLTIGMTQLCYQTIVQTFQMVIKKVVSTGSTTKNIEEDKK